jgi:S1-C subfamily serine protease
MPPSGGSVFQEDRMKRQYVASLAVVFMLVMCGPSAAESLTSGQTSSLTSRQIPSSVVQIFAQVNAAEADAPWIGVGIESVNGSGVIIEGNRILTVAHVVDDAVSLEVKRPGLPRRYVASVDRFGHECDLAILTVEDPSFFEGTTAVPIGKTPGIEDAVRVYGYPVGGEALSVTSGIVSRAEISWYSHSMRQLLLLQVDAAINNGNSGGPAIWQGALAGIAMQLLEGAENVGYIIPAEVIDHFLKDIEGDDCFDGFPTLGVQVQTLVNEALRKEYGLDKNTDGALVTSVNHGGTASGHLQPGDVITAIDGILVPEDLTIPAGRLGRLNFSYLIQSKQVGEEITLDFIRSGKKKKKTVRLENAPILVPGTHHVTSNSYYIFGGFVFQPLTLEYLFLYDDGDGWIPGDLAVHGLIRNSRTPERHQVILLTSVLPAPLNRGYQDYIDEVVMSVDGKMPKDMEDLVQIIEKASGPRLKFITETGAVLVLDLARARADQTGILKLHRITSGCSVDLQ